MTRRLGSPLCRRRAIDGVARLASRLVVPVVLVSVGCSPCRLSLRIERGDLPLSSQASEAVVSMQENPGAPYEVVITTDKPADWSDGAIHVHYYPFSCDTTLSGIAVLYADRTKAPEGIATLPPTYVGKDGPSVTLAFRRYVQTKP